MISEYRLNRLWESQNKLLFRYFISNCFPKISYGFTVYIVSQKHFFFSILGFDIIVFGIYDNVQICTQRSRIFGRFKSTSWICVNTCISKLISTKSSNLLHTFFLNYFTHCTIRPLQCVPDFKAPTFSPSSVLSPKSIMARSDLRQQFSMIFQYLLCV